MELVGFRMTMVDNPNIAHQYSCCPYVGQKLHSVKFYLVINLKIGIIIFLLNLNLD